MGLFNQLPDLAIAILMTFQDDGNVLLESLNKDYKPYVVEADQVMEVWKFYAYTSTEIPEAVADLGVIHREIRGLKMNLGPKKVTTNNQQ